VKLDDHVLDIVFRKARAYRRWRWEKFAACKIL